VTGNFSETPTSHSEPGLLSSQFRLGTGSIESTVTAHGRRWPPGGADSPPVEAASHTPTASEHRAPGLRILHWNIMQLMWKILIIVAPSIILCGPHFLRERYIQKLGLESPIRPICLRQPLGTESYKMDYMSESASSESEVILSSDSEQTKHMSQTVPRQQRVWNAVFLKRTMTIHWTHFRMRLSTSLTMPY
jgi:hypothetical protein